MFVLYILFIGKLNPILPAVSSLSECQTSIDMMRKAVVPYEAFGKIATPIYTGYFLSVPTCIFLVNCSKFVVNWLYSADALLLSSLMSSIDVLILSLLSWT